MKPFRRHSNSLALPKRSSKHSLALLLLAAWTLGTSVAVATPATVKGKAGELDPATLTPADWASWPEVSIPTVAEVQATCFEVERQCRRSGTAAARCAKEKRSCLAPSTM